MKTNLQWNVVCFCCYFVHSVYTGFILLGYYVVFTSFYGDLRRLSVLHQYKRKDISSVIVVTHRVLRKITSQNLDKRGDGKFEKNARNECSQTQVLTQNMYERHYSTPAIVSLKCSPVSVQDSPNAN